jgi:hypothetical protein
MRSRVFIFGSALLLACSSKGGGFGNGFDDSGSGPPGTDDGGTPPIYGDGSTPPLLGDGAMPPPQQGGCVINDPNADMDKDGWSPNAGDCNDCDPNVNPGAIDVLKQNDGGPPTWGDEDCDGTPGDSAQACDNGLALDDVMAGDGAKAIELCRTATMTDKKYGVLSANYVRADGTAFAAPGAQVGIQTAWGTNVHVQGGANMLVLSSGHARSVGQAGACNTVTTPGLSCKINATATPPTGFPQDDPLCPPTKAIFDDVALELQIRAPTNATGYSFNFKFHSFEYPNYVCASNGWNDQFVALVKPPPAGAYVPSGSPFGNISFDANMHPVSVNLGFFDTCDTAAPARFAADCIKYPPAAPLMCPTAPSPYCPAGLTDLAGTGFDVWDTKDGPGGATKWLATQAPVQGGSIVTVRFAIWDAGNQQYDSTVLIDNFQWIATPGVTVQTQPPPIVK